MSQVQKHRKSKKEYLNVKLPFTRKSPKRLTPSESATVSRTTAMMAKLESPRARAFAHCEKCKMNHEPKDSSKVRLEMKAAMQSIITPKLS